MKLFHKKKIAFAESASTSTASHATSVRCTENCNKTISKQLSSIALIYFLYLFYIYDVNENGPSHHTPCGCFWEFESFKKISYKILYICLSKHNSYIKYFSVLRNFTHVKSSLNWQICIFAENQIMSKNSW